MFSLMNQISWSGSESCMGSPRVRREMTYGQRSTAAVGLEMARTCVIMYEPIISQHGNNYANEPETNLKQFSVCCFSVLFQFHITSVSRLGCIL